MVRKTVSILLYICLFFAAITGCNTVVGLFSDNTVVTGPDYSGMQKAAERFSTLFMDWNKPLEERKKLMAVIAPTVVPFLVSGEQSVLYVETGIPYFSGARGFVDVKVWTTSEIIEDELKKDVTRKYLMSVYFVPDTVGGQVIEGMPLVSILPPDTDPRPIMNQEQETVKEGLKPTLEVFMPALLSGDLRSVQTLLKSDSQVVPYHGEYKLEEIQSIRVRDPSNPKLSDYAVDVVLKVEDVAMKQSLSIQVYLWIQVEGDKYYVVRANL